MASKAGAEIVPLSIVGSERVMPVGWVMPKVSSRSLKAKIVGKKLRAVITDVIATSF